jgi:hypothetical protein
LQAALLRSPRLKLPPLLLLQCQSLRKRLLLSQHRLLRSQSQSQFLNL